MSVCSVAGHVLSTEDIKWNLILLLLSRNSVNFQAGSSVKQTELGGVEFWREVKARNVNFGVADMCRGDPHI